MFWGNSAKVKLDRALYDKVAKVADVAGYATTDEFVAHVLEKEMLHCENMKGDDDIRAKLKGLGYIS